MERYYMNLNSSELHLLCTIETMSQSTQYSAGQSCPKSPALYQHAHTNTWINTYNNTCSCSEFSTVHWSCVYSLGKPVMYQPVSKSPGFCCNNMLKRPPSILHQFAAEPLWWSQTHFKRRIRRRTRAVVLFIPHILLLLLSSQTLAPIENQALMVLLDLGMEPWGACLTQRWGVLSSETCSVQLQPTPKEVTSLEAISQTTFNELCELVSMCVCVHVPRGVFSSKQYTASHYASLKVRCVCVCVHGLESTAVYRCLDKYVNTPFGLAER